MGNNKISLTVPHNLIKNLKTPQKATTTSSKNEEHRPRVCFPFGFLSQTGFAWLQFHFCLHFSQMRREQDVMFTPENKNEIIHTFFYAFLSLGLKSIPITRPSRHIWMDAAFWKRRKSTCQNGDDQDLKIIFEQSRHNVCFRSYTYASSKTYNEL